jgi:hypothetical protein
VVIYLHIFYKEYLMKKQFLLSLALISSVFLSEVYSSDGISSSLEEFRVKIGQDCATLACEWQAGVLKHFKKLECVEQNPGIHAETAIVLEEQENDGALCRSSFAAVLDSLINMHEGIEDVCACHTMREACEHRLVVRVDESFAELQRINDDVCARVFAKHNLPLHQEAIALWNMIIADTVKLMGSVIEVLKKPEYDKFLHELRVAMAESIDFVAGQDRVVGLLKAIKNAVINTPFDTRAALQQLRKLANLEKESFGSESFERERMRLNAFYCRDLMLPFLDTMRNFLLPKDIVVYSILSQSRKQVESLVENLESDEWGKNFDPRMRSMLLGSVSISF